VHSTVTLRDGTEVVVRPIEPTDKARLRRGFERLSADSRYRRFLSATPRLSEHRLAYLTEVDHRDHEAIVGIDPDTGEGLGVARYVRLGDEAGVAEAAVAVIDDAQGNGLGTALIRRLAQRAREERIERFRGLVLASNTDMIDMLERLGSADVRRLEGGLMEIDVDLPDGDEHAAAWRNLPAMLRAAATGAFELVSRPGRELLGEDR
jgi:GNAT superfamily N-acetyltransferase